MSTAKDVASLLLKEKAVFLRPHEPFTWTSGIKSPVYCDNRLLISAVETREKIIHAFCELISKNLPDMIAGTATAGIPWAAWIAAELRLPLIYVRSSSKEHGRKNAIEGKAPPNASCILIEDLISTGKSSIEAAHKLQEAQIRVEKIMSIFSYNFNQANALFAKEKLINQSLSTFDVLAQVAFDDNMLDEKSLNDVLEWRKSVVFP